MSRSSALESRSSKIGSWAGWLPASSSPDAHFQSPTVHCPLSTVHCPLSATQCPTPNAHARRSLSPLQPCPERHVAPADRTTNRGSWPGLQPCGAQVVGVCMFLWTDNMPCSQRAHAPRHCSFRDAAPETSLAQHGLCSLIRPHGKEDPRCSLCLALYLSLPGLWF